MTKPVPVDRSNFSTGLSKLPSCQMTMSHLKLFHLTMLRFQVLISVLSFLKAIHVQHTSVVIVCWAGYIFCKLRDKTLTSYHYIYYLRCNYLWWPFQCIPVLSLNTEQFVLINACLWNSKDRLDCMYQANALRLLPLNTDPDESLKRSNEQKGNKQEFIYKTVQYSYS